MTANDISKAAPSTEVTKNTQNDPNQREAPRGTKLKRALTSCTRSEQHILTALSSQPCSRGEKASGL
jgi:hypothetical protein